MAIPTYTIEELQLVPTKPSVDTFVGNPTEPSDGYGLSNPDMNVDVGAGSINNMSENLDF